MLLIILQCIGQLSTTKNELSQSANSGKVEKPLSSICFTVPKIIGRQHHGLFAYTGLGAASAFHYVESLRLSYHF